MRTMNPIFINNSLLIAKFQFLLLHILEVRTERCAIDECIQPAVLGRGHPL